MKWLAEILSVVKYCIHDYFDYFDLIMYLPHSSLHRCQLITSPLFGRRGSPLIFLSSQKDQKKKKKIKSVKHLSPQ